MFGGLGEALSSLGSGIIDGLVSFLTDPLGFIVDGFQWLMDFLAGLAEAIGKVIGEVLKSMFVPSDDFFDSHISRLQDKLSVKLNTQDYKDLLDSLNMATRANPALPDLTATLMGQKLTIVDMSWYSKYQSTIYGFVRGTMFVLLVIYNLNMVYKLVRKDELSHASENRAGGKK